jgi:hypothetical protein
MCSEAISSRIQKADEEPLLVVANIVYIIVFFLIEQEEKRYGVVHRHR